LLNFLVEVGNGRFSNAQAMARGWSDFIKLLPIFHQDRKALFSMAGLRSYSLLSRIVEADNYLKSRKHLRGTLIADSRTKLD
jgi:hypothetical protein